jgi:hypothetical protein
MASSIIHGAVVASVGRKPVVFKAPGSRGVIDAGSIGILKLITGSIGSGPRPVTGFSSLVNGARVKSGFFFRFSEIQGFQNIADVCGILNCGSWFA